MKYVVAIAACAGGLYGIYREQHLIGAGLILLAGVLADPEDVTKAIKAVVAWRKS